MYKKDIKILVLSDNHGDIKTMDMIIKKEKADYNIHCGDYLINKADMEKRFDYFVLGNNDLDQGYEEIKFQIGKFKFKLLHGHTLGINIYYKDKLINKIKDKDYDILIHGHLHIPIFYQKFNKTIFCPGSTSYPRDENGATYGIINISENGISFLHKKIR